MRTSIFIFLQNFQFFTSTPSLLAIPFAVSTLLAPSVFTSSSYLFPFVRSRLSALFLSAGLPHSSKLNLKHSQTALTSIFVLPFTLSFLLLAKASIIRALQHHQTRKWIETFTPLFITHLCNLFIILAANATCFCFLVMCFNVAQVLGLSRARSFVILSPIVSIFHSILLANVYMVCNLSLILAGIEKNGGFSAILKACFLIRGRTATALSLSVPIILALSGIEALFKYRVVRAYYRAMYIDPATFVEAIFVAYMYAALVVLDTIVGVVFLKSCRENEDLEIQEIDEMAFGEGKGYLVI